VPRRENPARIRERRLQLLRAAFREVAERGIGAATLDEIARRAGVSKGVTLYYFESKADMLRELFRWLVGALQERMREAIASSLDAAEQVRALVEVTFPSAERNRRFFKVYVDFAGVAARDESFRRIHEEFYAACRALDLGVVERGIEQGIFSDRSAAEAASTLRAIFEGLLLQWLMEDSIEGTFDAYRKRCEKEILQYLGAAD
jgi:TetR/AcrR family transcriptional regulator, fatty acid metabolism regulator protein